MVGSTTNATKPTAPNATSCEKRPLRNTLARMSVAPNRGSLGRFHILFRSGGPYGLF